jgi:hypothetical protein
MVLSPHGAGVQGASEQSGGRGGAHNCHNMYSAYQAALKNPRGNKAFANGPVGIVWHPDRGIAPRKIGLAGVACVLFIIICMRCD